MSDRTAFQIITDMVQDPKDNGDYELHLLGEDVLRLWKAAEADQDKIRRLERETISK